MSKRLDPGSDRAVYRQIADHLRRDINEQRIKPGAQLPSEGELMEGYGVSRVTICRAFGVLLSEGLVTSQHGRGWFTRRRPPIKRLGSGRFARRREGKAAFVVDMGASARPFTVDVLYIGPGVPMRPAQCSGTVRRWHAPRCHPRWAADRLAREHPKKTRAEARSLKELPRVGPV